MHFHVYAKNYLVDLNSVPTHLLARSAADHLLPALQILCVGDIANPSPDFLIFVVSADILELMSG